ncbi:MAG: hypothetical protein II137_02715, partial [Anaerovibrio sp.]|nr:hypothetical protein [Anaerovibrio sp.]
WSFCMLPLRVSRLPMSLWSTMTATSPGFPESPVSSVSALLPAMTARVDIVTSEKENALVVPISALKTDTKGSYVQLSLPDGTTEKRYVSTGIYSDEYVEIEDGLSDGDTVAITYKAKSSTATTSKNTRGGGPGGPPI